MKQGPEAAMTVSWPSRSRRLSPVPTLGSKPSPTERGANTARRSQPLTDSRTRHRSSRPRISGAAKAVRDGANREKHEFREQTKSPAGIYAGLAALSGGTRRRPESHRHREPIGRQPATSATACGGWRRRSPSDLSSPNRRDHRAARAGCVGEAPGQIACLPSRSNGVFIAAEESGEESLDAKNARGRGVLPARHRCPPRVGGSARGSRPGGAAGQRP